MLQAPTNRFTWWFTNQTTPSQTPGTSVVPGTSSAEGLATVLATAAQITEDVYEVRLAIGGGGTAATSKMHLLDIGYDPAGGTAYIWKLLNHSCGSSHGGERALLARFPLFIPSGSQIACRIQGNAATPGTVRVWATFLGRPTHPEAVWAGSYSETIGAITGSIGPTFVPGVSAAEGNWTSLGTTVQRLRHLTLGVQVDDAVIVNHVLWVDLAYGDATNKVILMEHKAVEWPGTGELMLQIGAFDVSCDLPSGSELFIRGSIDVGVAESNYSATVPGIG